MNSWESKSDSNPSFNSFLFHLFLELLVGIRAFASCITTRIPIGVTCTCTCTTMMMNSNVLEKIYGLKFPNEVPPALAMSIAAHNGYSEHEARRIMVESMAGRQTIHTMDQWIKSLKR